MSLLVIKQGREEPVWDFIARFCKETLCIPCLNVSIATIVQTLGTRDVILRRTLELESSSTLMLLALAQKHVSCEENTIALGQVAGADHSDWKLSTEFYHRDRGKHKRHDRECRDRDGPKEGVFFRHYTPLTIPPE